MISKTQNRKVHFAGSMPMQFTDVQDEAAEVTEQQRAFVDKVCQAVIAYVKSARQLVTEKYSHLRQIIPAYLSDPGNILVCCGDDGIVIRYERKRHNFHVTGGWRTESLSEFAKVSSQNIIWCLPPDSTYEITEKDGMNLSIVIQDHADPGTKTVESLKLILTTTLEPPKCFPKSPRKPFCLISARNEFLFQIEGEMVNELSGEATPFIASTNCRIPGGWDCIEVFPYVDLSQWNAEFAPLWAEMDILAAVAAHQHEKETIASLDPNSSVRKALSKQLKDFESLLNSPPQREEELHVFLKGHPHFLCPNHAQVWSKLAFGNKVSDFVFRDAAGEYLLVEIEQSTRKLFTINGDPTADLIHACSQITDWKRYIQHNHATIERELKLQGISTNPRSLIVIGRSSNLTDENRAKLTTMETVSPTQKIMTYDDVFLNARALVENMFGPLDFSGPETVMSYTSKALPAPNSFQATLTW